MEIKENYSFQVDSEIVKNVYQVQNNYLIEYTDSNPKEYCIIYFCSNDLYYPNTESAFTEQIIVKNRYEWYKNRVHIGYKHIFIRDIQKQWYLGGINSQLNSPQKLFSFLKKETENYKVITLGSSAGGYASVLYGSLLHAETILTFNGQYTLWDHLENSSEKIDPIIFRERANTDINKFYSLKQLIFNPNQIYYFYSTRSPLDIYQFNHISDLNIQFIPFLTKHHGIPFLKTNLIQVLNMSKKEMQTFVGKPINPVYFSIKMDGWMKTIGNLTLILINYLSKRIHQKINRK